MIYCQDFPDKNDVINDESLILQTVGITGAKKEMQSYSRSEI